MKQNPHSDSFSIYRSFFKSPVHLLWYLPLSLIILPILFFSDKRINFEQMMLIILILVAIPVGLESIRFFSIIITYPTFKGWKKNLPFALEGWEKLVQTEGFLSYQHWQLKVSVQSECARSEKNFSGQVLNTLENFVNKANKTFYAPNDVLDRFVDDPREKWKIDAERCKLEGSLNCQVAYRLYQLIRQELTPLAHHANIKKISIKPDIKSYFINPLRGQSESTAS